ncbi:MAG: RusA family crossover junction endodeoxyribonuclease [Phycisphaerales bacterium]
MSSKPRPSRSLRFTLPYPPSVNHYWRRAGQRTLISREGRRFRRAVCAILASERIEPLTGRLEIFIEICPPDRRRRDLDNVQKALLDALEHGGAYEDDSQIDRIVIERGEVVPSGRSRVEIRERRA